MDRRQFISTLVSAVAMGAARQAEAAMLIRYVLGLPISAAVVSMGSLEHLRANVAAARDQQPLNDGQRQTLEKHMS